MGIWKGIVLATALGAAATAQAVVVYTVQLSGANEVAPVVPDPDGSGTATLTIDDSVSPPTVSWNLVVSNIQVPIRFWHIHSAPAGANGPVVVDFGTSMTGGPMADIDLANVLSNPTGFYVNVHTFEHPAGAIRGQIPEPTTLSLLALGALAMLRRR
ncbi:MAG: CHRD domain-containing protein [Phycisphaerae bacterium]